MKRLSLLVASVFCCSLFSCAPWDQIANWKKCAVVTVTGNPVINKTENTQKREEGNSIAQIKNAVKESGGKSTNHDLQPDIDACAAKLMEKLATVSDIPLMKADEVEANGTYASLENNVDGTAKTGVGKALQSATSNWDTRPVPAAGYKILNLDQMGKLIPDLGVDGVITVAINFMYDLQGLGTLGSAKGVAEVTFTVIEKSGNGFANYALSFTGESEGKCDVKSGGFFKGEDMDPLLIEAFGAAVDQFIETAQKNLAKAKAKKSA
jgi:hypothetical protein